MALADAMTAAGAQTAHGTRRECGRRDFNLHGACGVRRRVGLGWPVVNS